MRQAIKGTIFFAAICALVAIIATACSDTPDDGRPRIAFESFSPTDTVRRNTILTVNLSFVTAASNLDSIYFRKVYVSFDTSITTAYLAPRISTLQRNGELTLKFINTQTSQASDLAEIGDPPRLLKFDYVMKYRIWAVDQGGNVSDTIETPSIYVKYYLL